MISQHSFTGVDDRCIHCGAKAPPAGKTDERSCVGQLSTEKLRPEPKRRIQAADDFEVINARIIELQKPVAAVDPVPPENDYCYC